MWITGCFFETALEYKENDSVTKDGVIIPIFLYLLEKLLIPGLVYCRERVPKNIDERKGRDQ